MPDHVNAVIDVLHAPDTPEPVKQWLRDSIAVATNHLFLGMAGFSIAVFAVLFITPRRFPECEPADNNRRPA